MTVLVVVLGLAVVGLAALAVLGRRRLKTQTDLTAAADRLAAEREVEVARTNTALEHAERERAAAEEQVTAVSAERTAAEEEARAARQRADDAEAERESARRDAQEAAAAALAAAREARAAEERASASEAERDAARGEAEDARAASERANAALALAEQRAGEAAVDADGAAGAAGLDPEFLWALEQSRTERTWRHSVALDPGGPSVFADSEDDLIEALQVELDAAREEVGVVVELDAQFDGPLTAAGSVLTLRAAQELLAGVVRRCEAATLQVKVDESDVLVTIEAVDEDGGPVAPMPLAASASVSPVDGGVRIHGVSPPKAESS